MNNCEKKSKKLPVLIFSIIIFFSYIYFLPNMVNSIPVNSMQTLKIIPSGTLAGMKMYVDGVLVVGQSDVVGMDNKVYEPNKKSKIKAGDIITKINETKIENSATLFEVLNKCNGEKLNVEYRREDEICTTTVTPVFSKEDNRYHIGLWVKDGAVGIGTISLYNAENNKFIALGHGITDVDTGKLLDISEGKIVDAQIVAIEKGKFANPGQVKGILKSENIFGDIFSNSRFGINGKVNNEFLKENVLEKYIGGIEIASIEEISNGKAYMLSMIDDNICEYEVKIKKLNNNSNRNILVEVIDERLIEKTGGIIQGMSGSPIIQNNKLIGILTHVLVNSPLKGYGIYGQSIIDLVK